ncbi:MAG: hypothetical protein AAB091_02560 [Elusimicrobiota bacterium]
MISILIVTHGDFGAYLLEAAEEIVGREPSQRAGVAAISRKLSLIEVRAKIETEIRQATQAPGAEGVIALCDMMGGTPCNEALLLARRMDRVEVLAGVNLYMVISALMNARRLSLAALTVKVLEDSRRSVANAKELLMTAKR